MKFTTDKTPSSKPGHAMQLVITKLKKTEKRDVHNRQDTQFKTWSTPAAWVITKLKKIEKREVHNRQDTQFKTRSRQQLR